MIFRFFKIFICLLLCYINIGCTDKPELVPEGANPPKYDKDFVFPVEYKKNLSSAWTTDVNSLNTLLVENIGRYPVRNIQVANEWGSRPDNLTFTDKIGRAHV